jgi:hypothetical protein
MNLNNELLKKEREVTIPIPASKIIKKPKKRNKNRQRDTSSFSMGCNLPSSFASSLPLSKLIYLHLERLWVPMCRWAKWWVW